MLSRLLLALLLGLSAVSVIATPRSASAAPTCLGRTVTKTGSGNDTVAAGGDGDPDIDTFPDGDCETIVGFP